jgi:hypothetical protein
VKRIVPIYPWPRHPPVAEVANPSPDITPVEALPSGPGPILSIRKPPPFVADAIVVMQPERVPEAVKIIIGDGLELVTVRDMVSEALGAPVVEKREQQRVRFQ